MQQVFEKHHVWKQSEGNHVGCKNPYEIYEDVADCRIRNPHGVDDSQDLPNDHTHNHASSHDECAHHAGGTRRASCKWREIACNRHNTVTYYFLHGTLLFLGILELADPEIRFTDVQAQECGSLAVKVVALKRHGGLEIPICEKCERFQEKKT